MRMIRLKIIVLAGLAGLNVVAALFAWRSVDGGERFDSLPPRSAPMIVPAAVSDAPIVAAGDDHETLSRPLFAKSRRPSQASARSAGAAGVAPPPAGLKLHAVIGFSGSARAFVTSTADSGGKWLRTGESFESWTVDAIGAQDIALRQEADLLRLGLDYDGVSAPVGPALAAAPPPPPRADNGGDAPPAKVVAPDAFAAMRDAKRGGH